MSHTKGDRVLPRLRRQNARVKAWRRSRLATLGFQPVDEDDDEIRGDLERSRLLIEQPAYEAKEGPELAGNRGDRVGSGSRVCRRGCDEGENRFDDGCGGGNGVEPARACVAAAMVVAFGRDGDRVSKVLGTSSDLLAVTLDVTSVSSRARIHTVAGRHDTVARAVLAARSVEKF